MQFFMSDEDAVKMLKELKKVRQPLNQFNSFTVINVWTF